MVLTAPPRPNGYLHTTISYSFDRQHDRQRLSWRRKKTMMKVKISSLLIYRMANKRTNSNVSAQLLRAQQRVFEHSRTDASAFMTTMSSQPSQYCNWNRIWSVSSYAARRNFMTHRTGR